MAKAKTIMHFQKDILKILNFIIGVTKYIKVDWVGANVTMSWFLKLHNFPGAI